VSIVLHDFFGYVSTSTLIIVKACCYLNGTSCIFVVDMKLVPPLSILTFCEVFFRN